MTVFHPSGKYKICVSQRKHTIHHNNHRDYSVLGFSVNKGTSSKPVVLNLPKAVIL